MLVNPVQSFHPNAPPPNDAILLTSDVRKTEESTARYAEWLRRAPRECARDCEVPLIFDEVYTGFRLAPGGAQEYFGVRADMVVYGKTVAGGMPIGVVCGKPTLMRRFDPERPMRIAYVVGTFSAHPVRDGRDERVPALGRARRATAELYAGDRTSAAPTGRWRPIGAGRRGAAAACGATWERCGRCCSRSRAATTGCCSTTCAPRV